MMFDEMRKICNLSPLRLRRLRSDIRLNSLFIKDYENRYGIDPEIVADFFNGYYDYLHDTAKSALRKNPDHGDIVLFDVPLNLSAYQESYKERVKELTEIFER